MLTQILNKLSTQITVVIITMAQFAITYLPALQNIFITESICFWDGALIIGVGVLLFTIIETEKQIRLRIKQT